MERKTILKPSTIAYDGMNSIDEISGEYQAYLKLLSNNDLKEEYQRAKNAWLAFPSVFYVRQFEMAKKRMQELGLLNENALRNDNYNSGREM